MTADISLTKCIYQALSYAILIMMLFDTILFNLTESTSPFNGSLLRVSHQRVSSIPVTSTTESIGHSSGSHRDKRAATAEASRLWDHGTIPYVYDSNFTSSDKETFALAMTIWERRSCVTFKEREDSDTDYIVFTVTACGCCSSVGRNGDGAQPVSLGPKCRLTGIVLHELGHAIGFWHEHTRPDRDKYVEVFLENIFENRTSNFNKMKPEEIDSLGEPYDFESIMHYGRSIWARNTYQDTILPKRLPGYPVRPDIGQRSHLSPGDIKQVNKLYKCASCGETLHEYSGTISYKPTPVKPETCHWRIRVAYGERVKLNITALGIPKSKDCKAGHLDVRDGANGASPRIGLYCGYTLPGALHSTGRRLWLEYKTVSGNGLGFNASYVRECGGEVKGTEGVIMSPTYNDRYLPKLNCSWIITLDPHHIIFITFEAFELENNLVCQYDYLEIREGARNSDPLLGTYCGIKIPPKLNSTASQLQLRFVSDSETERSGFHISFVKEIDECLHETHDCEHVCINTIGSFLCKCFLGYELKPDGKSCEKACGGIINTPSGTISSPFFPNPYPASRNCEWIIKAPQKNKIVLTFKRFDLELAHTGICAFDSVTVYPEGEANIYNRILLCGETLPKPITSKENTMKVVFTSDRSDEKPGFLAVFSSKIIKCKVKNGGC